MMPVTYHPLQCEVCESDLTAPEAIVVELAPTTGHAFTLLSRVDTDGALDDPDGYIEEGLHAVSACAACGAVLPELDPPVAAEPVAEPVAATHTHTVYTAVVTHRHGVDVFVAASDEARTQVLADYCMSWTQDVQETVAAAMQAAYDAGQMRDVCYLYFTDNDGESIECEREIVVTFPA